MENLGKIGTDSITGFKGKIIAITHYFIGVPSYCLQPEIDESGKFIELQWFNAERIIIAD